MRIPAVDTFLSYTAGVSGAGVNDFVAPDLTPSGVAYVTGMSTLVVHLDGVPSTNYTLNSSNIVHFPSDLVVGTTVKLWRTTEILTSLVVLPTSTTKLTPAAINKGLSQSLLGIQEVWGGLKELDTSIAGQLADTIETVDDSLAAQLASVTQALAGLQSYVNAAIAGVFEFSGTAVATWSTNVSDGDTSVTTPYLFTKGILMVGGSMYNLSNPAHVTLSVVAGVTVITFVSAIVGDHEAILIVL